MTSHKAANRKLPKLVITKFSGTHVDWLRFWNQFEAEIDTAVRCNNKLYVVKYMWNVCLCQLKSIFVEG